MQAPAGVLSGDRRGFDAHLLYGAKRGSRQPVAERGAEQERNRRDDDQGREKLPERIVAIAEGRSGHDRQATILRVDLLGPNSQRAVDSGDAATLDLQRAGLRFLKLGGGEDARAPARGDDLGERLFFAPHPIADALPSKRAGVGEPVVEALVDGFVERRADAEVHERSGGGEDDRHRDRERERQAQPDRKPVHASRSR